MKSFFLPIVFISLSFNVFSQTQSSINLFLNRDPNRQLGLVAHLAYIKINAEQKMIVLSKKMSVKPDCEKDSLCRKLTELYNKLQVEIDQFILQLSVDLINKNSLRTYRDIDFFYKKNTELTNTSYEKILNQIDVDFATFMWSSSVYALDGGGELVVSIFEKFSSVITSARDFREKKVGSICEVLDKLRLKSIGELGEEDKPDGPKTKKKES